MASLLPLLYDLLPIIMPSEVHISRDRDLTPVFERAEGPPYHQRQPSPAPTDPPAPGHERQAALSAYDEQASSLVESDQGKSCEPIQLLDREESSATQPTPKPISTSDDGSRYSDNYTPCHPVPSAQVSGPRLFRKDAMVGVTDKMCATVLTVGPRSASAVRHHGEQDTIIYVTRGCGVLLISPALDPVRAIRADIKGEAPTREEEQPQRHELSPGDFVFIPAWTEHQVVNEAEEGDIVWVLIQSGGERVQVDLDGWGGERIQQ
ncbi:hypothetical protein N8I77_012726 [Diaporthe amygdali]|uniref:Cupin type-2 domain-containing protein n=1 Tax=Phomopsis amygdali TaxID=1214568 RepID=A0AAD9S298_PHOAM|nr:hypothetical protein N8I77_012726 [Diaporthe amygdali]